MQKLITSLKNMLGKKILVIGDMVADVYLQGQIGRISREAPVLILQQVDEKIVPGGAANVVSNASTLGGEVFAVGVVGDDAYAAKLRELLEKDYGVHIEGLVTDADRPTVSKVRVIAGGRATVSQQVVRIDNESKEPLSKKIETQLIAKLDEILPQVEGIVLSDYGAGTITENVKKWLINYAGKNKIPSIVDSRYDIGRFSGVGFVKQSDTELAAFVGHEINTMGALIEGGAELLRKTNASAVLITRGEKGMSLFERSGAVHHIPVSDKSEVFDVSGAGDTCVAAFILGLTGNFSAINAARLANYAAGIAVRKLGTSTVSFEELERVLGK